MLGNDTHILVSDFLIREGEGGGKAKHDIDHNTDDGSDNHT